MYLAFYQASHLLRLIGKTPTDKIYYTDDFSLSYSHPELDFWEINRFYECILRAEEEQALNIVLSIQKNIKELGYIDESEIQQIFYSFRQVFVRIKNELPQQYSSLIPIPTYDDTTDIFALFKHIIKCTCACCDCIKIQQEKAKQNFEQSVLSFIDNNIINPDLYIKFVTDHFNINENTLQAIVQKLTGKSFFEYIEYQRMKKAEQLIRYTSIPISDIFIQCGYSTHNSFTAFKRTMVFHPVLCVLK